MHLEGAATQRWPFDRRGTVFDLPGSLQRTESRSRAASSDISESLESPERRRTAAAERAAGRIAGWSAAGVRVRVDIERSASEPAEPFRLSLRGPRSVIALELAVRGTTPASGQDTELDWRNQSSRPSSFPARCARRSRDARGGRPEHPIVVTKDRSRSRRRRRRKPRRDLPPTQAELAHSRGYTSRAPRPHAHGALPRSQ